MRKFTKEISALLAAAAVGTTAYASLVSATSEPEAQVEGLMVASDDTTETTTEELFEGVEMAVETTEPPMAGEPIPSDEFIETTTEEIVPLAGDIAMADGDINGDGTFGVSDAVLLQKWLLAVPDTHLSNWWAADYNYDGRLDVFDLCLMKRELINSGIVQPATDLRTKFPEYYDRPTTKGLEVYLWQENDGSYKCGLLMGTNRNKTDEELIGLTHNGATIEQMKEILSSYNVNKDMIAIIPVQILESSYKIIESDFSGAEKLFWGDSPATNICKATITDVNGDTIIVKPVEGSQELRSADKFSLSASMIDAGVNPTVGMTLEIDYDGGIQETYPASFGRVQKVTVISEPYNTLSTPDDKGTLMNDIEYEISMGDYYDSQYKDHGYYCDVIDGKYLYTICSGEHSTGGYEIKITGLDILNFGTVIITVEESAPSSDMSVTEAFTYPNCTITFSRKLPAGIIIKSSSGTKFECLGN